MAKTDTFMDVFMNKTYIVNSIINCNTTHVVYRLERICYEAEDRNANTDKPQKLRNIEQGQGYRQHNNYKNSQRLN